MRIALVSPVLPPAGESGIGSATLHLGLGLVAAGHSVDAFTWLDGGRATRRESLRGIHVTRLAVPSAADSIETAVALGLRAVRTLSVGRRAGSFSGAARDLRGALACSVLARSGALDDYDAVEAPEWGGGVSCLTRRALGGVKVARLHASLYSHAVRYAPFVRLDPIEVAIATAVERRGVSAADVVIAPSQAMRNDARMLMRSTSRIVDLPNGIDLAFVDALKPRNGGATGDDVVRVAFVGRIDRMKGAHVLNEILRRLRSKPDGKRWDFHVVGDWTASNAAEFEEIRKVDHPYVTVYLHGVLDTAKVLRLLWSCDVLFFPSQAENCPMTVLEGMACGLAIVASGVGGVSEMLPGDNHALLCDPSDVDAFESGLRSMASRASRECLGVGARERAASHYSSRLVAEQWEALVRAADAR